MELTPRPLTRDEREILEQLLSPEFEGVDALRDQAKDVRVVGGCDCGCPSVYLEPKPGRRRSDQVGPLAPVELAVAAEAEEAPGEVILFLDDGKLSYLEYVYYSQLAPKMWPSVERLSPTRVR